MWPSEQQVGALWARGWTGTGLGQTAEEVAWGGVPRPGLSAAACSGRGDTRSGQDRQRSVQHLSDGVWAPVRRAVCAVRPVWIGPSSKASPPVLGTASPLNTTLSSRSFLPTARGGGSRQHPHFTDGVTEAPRG